MFTSVVAVFTLPHLRPRLRPRRLTIYPSTRPLRTYMSPLKVYRPISTAMKDTRSISLPLCLSHSVTERPVAAASVTDQPPPPPVKYSRSMPLPTYAQSEKYETEGVLDFHLKDAEGDETDDETPRYNPNTAGTWCEFMLFFVSKCCNVHSTLVCMLVWGLLVSL